MNIHEGRVKASILTAVHADHDTFLIIFVCFIENMI